MSIKKFFVRCFLKTIVLAIGSLCLYSCQNKDTHEKALARVYDEYLYISDVKDFIPSGLSSKDSLQSLEALVSAWVEQKILVHKAKSNLHLPETYFDAKLEEYKNSLYIYTYQTQLTKDFLDTIVSDLEIEEYHQEHPQQFYLKSNIVKVRFVKVQSKNKEAAKIKKVLFKDNPEGKDLLALSQLCEKHAVNYYLDNEKWLYFNEILKEIPIQTYNQEDFLTNYKKIETSSGEFTYFVCIDDFRIKESTSPLSFEKEKIRTIILNIRQQKLIESMRKQVLEDARQQKEVEIFQ